MTPRAMGARLTRAAERAVHGPTEDAATAAETQREVARHPGSDLGLEEALSLLDDLADGADALTARIQALLADGAAPGRDGG